MIITQTQPQIIPTRRALSGNIGNNGSCAAMDDEKAFNSIPDALRPLLLQLAKDGDQTRFMRLLPKEMSKTNRLWAWTFACRITASAEKQHPGASLRDTHTHSCEASSFHTLIPLNKHSLFPSLRKRQGIEPPPQPPPVMFVFLFNPASHGKSRVLQ